MKIRFPAAFGTALPLLAAFAVFTIGTLIGVHEARTEGIIWAEDDYLDHVDAIEGWLGSGKIGATLHSNDPARPIDLHHSRDNLDAPFWEARRFFNPHPPLYKYLALLSRTIFHWRYPVAERFPTALAFGGACVALFWTLLKRRGWVAAVVGATALATMPRLVSYAGFVTPDLPLAAAWLWIALAFERYEQTKKRGWLVLCVAIFAYALCSKLSALVMLAPLGLLVLLWRRKQGIRSMITGGLNLGLVLVSGLIALVLLYPFLWPAPLSRLLLLFEEARTWGVTNPFTAMWFGEVVPYTQLPWYFAPVMIAMVTPPLTLALSLVGALWPKTRDSLWQLAVTVLGFWLLFELLPNTPKYDNDRQLLPLFPFFALLAGLGASDLADRLSARVQPRLRRLVPAVLTGATALALSLELAGAQPFPMSYFSPLIGGASGAAAKGFEVTYAMDVLSPEVLSDFQSVIPNGSGLNVRPALSMGPFLQRHGFLRGDLQLNPDRGPFFILVYRHWVLRNDLPVLQAHAMLLKTVSEDGVPLAELWYLPPGTDLTQ